MSDSQLLRSTILSVQDTPINVLLKNPIFIYTKDIDDLQEFKFSLDSSFKETGIPVLPDQIIQFIDEDEDILDSWDESDDDDFELCAFDSEPCVYTTSSHNAHSGKVITLKQSKPKKINKDTFDYSFRPILPVSDKTWDVESINIPPPSPVEFKDNEDIVYPPTPPLPEEPFKNETFDNFITNGQIKENGKFKGVMPTPINLVFSIKVQQALDLKITKLENGGFHIVAKPKIHRPRLLNPEMMSKSKPKRFNPKSQICKHGSNCKFKAQGRCIFAHRLSEWEPQVCLLTSCENLTSCRFYHPKLETKKEYYKRRHNINK